MAEHGADRPAAVRVVKRLAKRPRLSGALAQQHERRERQRQQQHDQRQHQRGFQRVEPRGIGNLFLGAGDEAVISLGDRAAAAGGKAQVVFAAGLRRFGRNGRVRQLGKRSAAEKVARPFGRGFRRGVYAGKGEADDERDRQRARAERQPLNGGAGRDELQPQRKEQQKLGGGRETQPEIRLPQRQRDERQQRGQAALAQRDGGGKKRQRPAEQRAGGQAACARRDGQTVVDICVGGFAERKQIVYQQLCALARGRKRQREQREQERREQREGGFGRPHGSSFLLLQG